MDEKHLKRAEELADRDYGVIISVEQTTTGKTLYMAKNPELLGCMAQGETLEDAIKNLRDARIDYIYDSLESNSPVPEPAEKKVGEMQTETSDTSTYIDANIANLTIHKVIPANVPSEPMTPRIKQYIGA